MALGPKDLGVILPAIPFDKTVKFVHGQCDRLSPSIRRVVAPNENAFSFRGTGTYIVGQGNVAVIDPGPLIDSHVQAILEAVKGERVTHILITHTHNDHSPAAAPLKAATGAKTYAFGPHGSGHDEDGPKIEEGGDMEFCPDEILRDGDIVAGPGWTFEAVYTPGHTSNHLCFALKEEKAFFPGDHVMGWSTTVIGPPDGDMAAYFESLHKLLPRDDVRYYPTHGAPIDAPQDFVRRLIDHRKAREAQVLAALRLGLHTIPEMVAVIYAEVDKRLHPAAGLSVKAHLNKLIQDGAVRVSGSRYDARKA
jgi:glyoxylase-like metal-dependent hydrolase (beta-lactamase superfamily II)